MDINTGDIKQLLRKWSTLVTLVVLLSLLLVGVVWGYKTVTKVPPGPEPIECQTSSMSVLEPKAVTVNVYNGGSMRGLAGRTATRLEGVGFIIDKIENKKDAKVLTVMVVGTSEDSPEVQLVAGMFKDPQIVGDGRVDHTVEVIVGNSFEEATAYAEQPKLIIDIPSGTVCLPAPTQTATQDVPTMTGDPTAEPT
ncbi:MAG: LytR C-terminal domain-containing protein [Propionibacteriaceae bacterium]|nr:LytR C-terminal domain-containing protein [Propionibacteriaceae bacterium]